MSLNIIIMLPLTLIISNKELTFLVRIVTNHKSVLGIAYLALTLSLR